MTAVVDQKFIAETPARPVAMWLFAVAALVAMMIVIGGVTRLTDSGLSMVEWRPWRGLLPPLSTLEWQRVFELYQQSPEFQQLNFWMSLDDFKTIFWWEFIHRVWGRLIGLAFVVPLLWFWVRGALPAQLKPRLIVLLLLGGSQGVIGWWMVKSGLVDDPAVSQYRLATHLLMAMLILGLLLWTALDARGQRIRAANAGRLSTLVCFCLLIMTIGAGALVAGLDAGLAYNTFPLMDQQIVPPGYFTLAPWWLNMLENTAAVQFNHRLLAVLAAAAIISNGIYLGYTSWAPATRLWAKLSAALAGLQFLLGVAVLLLAVPVSLGALHQFTAVALFAAMIALLHGLFNGHGSAGR